MFDSLEELSAKLAATGYFIDRVMAQVVFLAIRLKKPLLLEGPAGSGKPQLVGKMPILFADWQRSLRRQPRDPDQRPAVLQVLGRMHEGRDSRSPGSADPLEADGVEERQR